MTPSKTDSSFSAAEARTLAAVLCEIIPSSGDGRLPEAGDLVADGRIEPPIRLLPDLRPAIAAGLKAVEESARARDAKEFVALSRDQRLDVLNEVASKDPGFIPSLMFVVYTTYYQDERVLEALSFEARPPHPKGYEMPPNDLSLLDPVRRRAKLYREC